MTEKERKKFFLKLLDLISGNFLSWNYHKLSFWFEKVKGFKIKQNKKQTKQLKT